MSLWTSIRNTVTGAAKGLIASGGSPIGALTGAITQGRAFNPVQSMASLPSIISAGGAILPKLPSLPGVGQVVATVGRAATGAATAKYVYDAITGTYKPMRRRRAKGITAAQLRGFKRVAKILHDYQRVAVKHHVKAPARRR